MSFKNVSYMDSVYSLGCGSYTAAIESKGAAMFFAILMSSSYCGQNNIRRINYKKAQRLFDFICSNINLPDVKTEPMDGLNAQLGGLVGILEKTIAEKYAPAHKKDVSES